MDDTASASPVPFNDLGRNTEQLRSEIDAAIARVLDSGWYVLGPEHSAFEAELATHWGADDAALVGNGTDALQLALTAVGVGAGDSVLTVANAGGYTSTAARSLGAVPVFADVDPNTLLLSLNTFEDSLGTLTKAPKAVVITHLYGAAVDAGPLVERAAALGIAVVEDCAQSIGASINGRKAGTFGDVATTSFYPTKNLGALGDGGAVITSNPEIAQRVRQLRQYGWESKYRTSVAGGRNSRLDEMQAAILRVKLPQLDGWNERRRDIHRRYEDAIGSGGRMVHSASDSFVGHLAVLEVADRGRALEIFRAAGIGTDVHYPIPDHAQPLVEDMPKVSLPVTELMATRVVSVPLFPELRADEVDRVCAALSEI